MALILAPELNVNFRWCFIRQYCLLKFWKNLSSLSRPLSDTISITLFLRPIIWALNQGNVISYVELFLKFCLKLGTWSSRQRREWWHDSIWPIPPLLSPPSREIAASPSAAAPFRAHLFPLPIRPHGDHLRKRSVGGGRTKRSFRRWTLAWTPALTDPIFSNLSESGYFGCGLSNSDTFP